LAEITEVTGSSVTSVNRWWQIYRTEGIAGLVDGRSGGNSAKLTPEQMHDLADKLRAYPPAQTGASSDPKAAGQCWTVADLQYYIEQWYGVTYRSTASYINLLQRCGVSHQRNGSDAEPTRKRDEWAKYTPDQ
jgi:transposase